MPVADMFSAFRKRKFLALGVGVAAAAVALAAFLLRGESAIRPLLPMAGQQPACFTGTFARRTMDVEDWGRATLQPTGRLSPDGKPIMRNVPPRTPDVAVASFTLRLDHDSRKASYDWIYNFRLRARMDRLGELDAIGECPWYEKDFRDAMSDWSISGNTTTLYCGIDCDGGEVSISRIHGTGAITLAFHPTIGLRMKKGCGGGGPYRVLANASGGEFRLEPAPAATCANLPARFGLNAPAGSAFRAALPSRRSQPPPG